MTTTRTRRQVLAGLAAGPILMLSPRARAAEVKGRITVLHTNDTHSRMEPFASGKYKGRGGVAKRMTLIRNVRAENPHTVVLDAGDTFQGTTWFNQFKGAVDMRVLDALGYDATAVGNHDFDAGAEQLAKNLELAPRLAPLASNFLVTDDSPLAGRILPHTVVQRGEVRVGVFGLGVRFEGLVNPKLHPGVQYSDPRAAAAEQVALLRQRGCHVVLAASHLGYTGYRGEVGDTDWPKDVPGVNYVVGGHTHTFLDQPTRVRHASGWETAVMQVGHSGLNLGRADIVVDAQGRADIAYARPVGVGGRAIV